MYLPLAKKQFGMNGLVFDHKGHLYVAGFSQNQIHKVDTAGNVTVIAQQPDNDGANGELNQPADLIVFGNKLVISNFNLMVEPGTVNTKQ